jgi:hypothetical protein
VKSLERLAVSHSLGGYGICPGSVEVEQETPSSHTTWARLSFHSGVTTNSHGSDEDCPNTLAGDF